MKRLILASGSPRRKVLMDCMGLQYTVIPSNFDENLDDKRSAQEVAIELGFGKAMDVAKQYPDAYVVGCDSIVVIDGKQLAKPANAAEAYRMLRAVSGRTHDVVSSVVVVCINDGVQDKDVDTVQVTFGKLPEDIIASYIATDDPYDKAGGYAKQHPLLRPYISTQGNAHTGIGLPTELLRKLLIKNGIEVPNNELKTNELFRATLLSDFNIVV